MTKEMIVNAAMALTPSERAEIAALLEESLESEDWPLSDSWKQELDRRLDDVLAGKEEGIPAEQVHEELRRDGLL